MSKSGTQEEQKSKLTGKINDFLGVAAIDDTLEKGDIAGIEDTQMLADYVVNIAFEELEKLMKQFSDEETFFKIER
jgi:hypothetical protein